jgi:hypothetical protein
MRVNPCSCAPARGRAWLLSDPAGDTVVSLLVCAPGVDGRGGLTRFMQKPACMVSGRRKEEKAISPRETAFPWLAQKARVWRRPTETSGDPAVMELAPFRPVILRPHLSMGLPFSAVLACRRTKTPMMQALGDRLGSVIGRDDETLGDGQTARRTTSGSMCETDKHAGCVSRQRREDLGQQMRGHLSHVPCVAERAPCGAFTRKTRSENRVGTPCSGRRRERGCAFEVAAKLHLHTLRHALTLPLLAGIDAPAHAWRWHGPP